MRFPNTNAEIYLASVWKYSVANKVKEIFCPGNKD